MTNQRATTGKNVRSRERNNARRATKRAEAEARQAIFDALPQEEKDRRRASRLRRKTATTK